MRRATEISLFEPAVTDVWLPILIAVLGAQAVLQVLVYVVGRWTMSLAAVFAVLEVSFAAPIVWLALSGAIVNPAFAAQIGYPPLADNDGPVMLAIAVFTTLVTAWEVFDAFRRARRESGAAPLVATSILPG